MFVKLLDTPLSILALGARAHGVLNARRLDEIAEMMEREDWTCGECGIRLPGMMEVDHLGAHKPSGGDRIAPICRICHDRKHLLWAGSRGGLTLIHAPDLSYPEISQFAWAVAAHSGRDGFNPDSRKLSDCFDARRRTAVRVIGHGNVEAVFEAVLTMADVMGRAEVRERLAEVDRRIRIAPTLLVDGNAPIRVWTENGFRTVPDHWRERAVPKDFPDCEMIARAGNALAARLRGGDR